MPTNQTPNYSLSQWERADKILMDDFNADNAKIDAALAEHDKQLAKLPLCGNCQLYTTAYTGGGTYGADAPNTLTFPHKPVAVMINCAPGFSFFMLRGSPQSLLITANSAEWNYLTWNGNSVSWHGPSDFGQMNQKNVTYYVVALLQMD